MKIVILGAKGMLGSDLAKVFADFKPHLFDKDEIDITNKNALIGLLKKIKPDIVINAAAYTDVDGCEENRDLAMKVNADAPGYLAEVSESIGAIFVHYSTDYVFSGNNENGYSEDDDPGDPVNFYGESKLAGEIAVRKSGGNYYIIRTSWLFGSGGPKINGRPRNFVETILRLAEEKSELRVVNDQHGKPTFSLDLGQRTRYIIERKKDFGIYHVTNEPATTWYEFAKEIAGIPIIVPCKSSEFPRSAKRPGFSILLNTKLPPMRSWQEALEDYLKRRRDA